MRANRWTSFFQSPSHPKIYSTASSNSANAELCFKVSIPALPPYVRRGSATPIISSYSVGLCPRYGLSPNEGRSPLDLTQDLRRGKATPHIRRQSPVLKRAAKRVLKPRAEPVMKWEADRGVKGGG